MVKIFTTMSKHVRVVFDRRKRVEATGKGNVEIIIQLSRLAVKKIIGVR